MMFKNVKKVVVALCCLLFFLQTSIETVAKETDKLPQGDILIIYSDAASNKEIENVRSMVEYLTYQSFQVTYASASDSLRYLDEFSSIICYKIEKYPKEIIQALAEREKEGNDRLKKREKVKNSSGEKDIRLLFIGNEFLQAYLNETGREQTYIESAKETGKLKYYFSDSDEKEALVKEDNFLFLSEKLDYQAGEINVEGLKGYFCARIGALTHIPVTDLTNDLILASFVKEVALWKWPYRGEPYTYAQYIVLDKVYPFQNEEKLLQVIDYLIGRKQPFVISVMPIYDHGNYPSMQRFCEILRYAQANGGTIILHSPINQMPDFDTEIINDSITTAVQIYMAQGVYPMGIEVPRNWMFYQDTIEIMSRFRTVLVSEEEDTLIKPDKDSNTNLVYQDGHQWIAPNVSLDNNGVSYLKTNSFAVKLDISKDLEVIENKIDACITSFVPLKNLWDMEHSFWTEEDIMSYKNQIIRVNGKRVEKDFIPTEYEKEFKYNRNTLQRYSKDLTKVNRRLIIVVLIISFLFITFILAARHRNKQTFFIKKKKK